MASSSEQYLNPFRTDANTTQSNSIKERLVDPVYKVLQQIATYCANVYVMHGRKGVTTEEMQHFSERDDRQFDSFSQSYGFENIVALVLACVGEKMYHDNKFYALDELMVEDVTEMCSRAREFFRIPKFRRVDPTVDLLFSLESLKVAETNIFLTQLCLNYTEKREKDELASMTNTDLLNLDLKRPRTIDPKEVQPEALIVFQGYDVRNVRRISSRFLATIRKVNFDILYYDIRDGIREVERYGLKYILKTIDDDALTFVWPHFKESAVGKVVVVSGVSCMEELVFLMKRYKYNPYVVSLEPYPTKKYLKFLDTLPQPTCSLRAAYTAQYVDDEDLDIAYLDIFEMLIRYLEYSVSKDIRCRIEQVSRSDCDIQSLLASKDDSELNDRSLRQVPFLVRAKALTEGTLVTRKSAATNKCNAETWRIRHFFEKQNVKT